jgi:Ca2+-binding EF-hand superfamily protein
LTDLGEEYTQNEVALIARTIDPDRLGLIELPEFVRWWTADRVTA